MSQHWGMAELERAWTARGLDRRRLLKLVGAGAAMTAMTEFAMASPVAAQEGDESQLIIEWTKPRTLGPLFSTSGSEQQVERALMGVLVLMTGNLEQVGDLAESFEISDDARDFTFHLHPDATFNDGEPFTADDVVFTLHSAINPDVGSFWQGRLMGIEGAEAYVNKEADTVSGIEVVDDYTVVLHMTEPDTTFIPTFADFTGLGMLPKHILGDIAPDQLVNHSFNLEPTVGAGPYQFVTYETDQHLEMEANPNWLGDPPQINRVFLKIVEPDVAVAELEQGSMDLIRAELEDIERFESMDGITVVSVESPSLDTVAINLDKEYFQDKRVRQAMMYALDRQTITEQLFLGKAVVQNSPIFGPDWMGIPEGLNEYAYDPEKAKSLLEEAGWDSNFQPVMIYHEGASSVFANMVPIVQAQWAAVGFNVELQQTDSVNQHLITDHDYDLYIGGGGVYGAHPSISAKYYHSDNLTPNGGNYSRYVNTDVDKLYAEAKVTADQDQQVAIYTQIAQILNDECPSVYLWSPNTNFAIRDRLQGFEAPRYVNNRIWNIEDWSLAESDV